MLEMLNFLSYIQNITEYKYPCIVPFIHKEHLLVVLKEDLELACKHCSTCVYGTFYDINLAKITVILATIHA